jgi:RNA 3'-terminal phosphate cyclase (ATP)
MGTVLTLNGAHGEGGGQILRTALILSATTQRPIRIANICSARRKPGLMPQHLSALRATATICDAAVSGDLLGSTEIAFLLRHAVAPGDYNFDVADSGAW